MGYIKKNQTYPSLKEQEQTLDDFFNQEVDPETAYFIEYSMAIAVEVAKELDKQGLTQKDLAIKLDKRESEISKWLSGTHNFTLKSIAKLSAALGKKLIFTPNKQKVISAKNYKHGHKGFASRKTMRKKRRASMMRRPLRHKQLFHPLSPGRKTLSVARIPNDLTRTGRTTTNG